MELALWIASIVVNGLLLVGVAVSLQHNLRGCPGIRAQRQVAQWDLALTQLTEEIVERTRRMERVRAQVTRERGIIEKRLQASQPTDNGADVGPEDLAWLRQFAEAEPSPDEL